MRGAVNCPCQQLSDSMHFSCSSLFFSFFGFIKKGHMHEKKNLHVCSVLLSRLFCFCYRQMKQPTISIKATISTSWDFGKLNNKHRFFFELYNRFLSMPHGLQGCGNLTLEWIWHLNVKLFQFKGKHEIKRNNSWFQNFVFHRILSSGLLVFCSTTWNTLQQSKPTVICDDAVKKNDVNDSYLAPPPLSCQPWVSPIQPRT